VNNNKNESTQNISVNSDKRGGIGACGLNSGRNSPAALANTGRTAATHGPGGGT